MSENATVNRTKELQQVCSPLFNVLTQKVQHFLTATGGMLPYIESIKNGFIVHDLPKDITLHQVINDSAFELILHRIRHLYTDGSTSGKTEARQKISNGELLENNSLRLYITYTYTLLPEYTETDEVYGQKLVVRFSLNNFKANPHKILKSIPRAKLSTKQLKRLQYTDGIINSTEDTVTAWFKMTTKEISTHVSACISTCREEIQEHINKVARRACANGEQPNYLVFG